jgi:hypothetical protein
MLRVADSLQGNPLALLLTPPHATPAPVARDQGGLTLGPERGELGPDFCHLPQISRATSNS